MIEFYLNVYDKFPVCFFQSLKNLKQKKFVKSKSKKSYYSIPNRKDYDKFLKKKGNIILFRDFFKINKLL